MAQDAPAGGDIDGYIFPPAGEQGRYKKQVVLPVGAEVTEVCWIAYDCNDEAYWGFYFMGYESALDYETRGMAVYSYASTPFAGGTNHQKVCSTLDPPVLIRPWADLDEDGDYHDTVYALEAFTGGDHERLQLFGAVVGWNWGFPHRLGEATFNDVPSDHWAFPFVEALAASGITGGCGGGDYCPDSYVTRAQMAVYLAAALDMH
jgi:hypothetical protein